VIGYRYFGPDLYLVGEKNGQIEASVLESDNFWGIQAGVKQSGKIKFLTKLNIAPVKEKITP
jgi:hypothetical protein